MVNLDHDAATGTHDSSVINSLTDLSGNLATLDSSFNTLVNNQRKLKCRLINKGKQVPMYYETPNPFSDLAANNEGKKITTLAKAQFLRGDIIRDRNSLHPIINDGSINYHIYSYVVSFWWIVSSILSPLTIGLLIFIWQYNSASELNSDTKSKLLGIVKPLLEFLAIPASYDITILKKGGTYNNDLLRPLIGLVVIMHIFYIIFKYEENSWSLWIFTVYGILIMSFLLLILLTIIPGSYWYERESLLGKGPMPIVISILSYFIITYYVEEYVIMDMQRIYDV
jgi:hypothetical protein